MAADEHRSPSPQPAQPMTKRDQRRNKIMDKLEGVIASFAANQQQNYRAQLLAIQADMTLILRADPYTNVDSKSSDGTTGDSAALDDSGDAIRDKIAELGAQLPEDEDAQRSYWAIAGTAYRTFARSVNDSIEERDGDMTALHNHYEASLSELDRLTYQKLHQADEEHKHLANTIRQRLITAITKKRQQLLRDKEQLDIADSNALLLHPSHYSINNPGSPGGALANRKTRHLRHRAGSPSAGEVGVGEGKRKRKLTMLEEDSNNHNNGNESPGPAGLGGLGLGLKALPATSASTDAFLLGGGRSPFKDARDKNSYTQYEAPAYSLERIFTDKELALATDTARNATFRYFHQPPLQPHGGKGATEDQSAAGTNGAGSIPSPDGDTAGDATADDTTAAGEASVATPPPGGAEMVRETSHQVLTRGGARANPLAALTDLAVAAASASAAGGGGGAGEAGAGYGSHLLNGGVGASGASVDPFAPQFPPWHAVTRPEKSSAPGPTTMSALEVEGDFSLMRRAAAQSRRRPGDGGHDADGDAVMGGTENEGGAAGAEAAASAMRRQLLDQALGTSITSQPYRLPLLETGPAIVGKGVDRPAATAFSPALTVEQRLKLQQQQQAAAAAAKISAPAAGSMAAALQGRFGGEPMSRTTSTGAASEIGGGAAGSEIGGGAVTVGAVGGGRRGRARLV